MSFTLVRKNELHDGVKSELLGVVVPQGDDFPQGGEKESEGVCVGGGGGKEAVTRRSSLRAPLDGRQDREVHLQNVNLVSRASRWR